MMKTRKAKQHTPFSMMAFGNRRMRTRRRNTYFIFLWCYVWVSGLILTSFSCDEGQEEDKTHAHNATTHLRTLLKASSNHKTRANQPNLIKLPAL